MSWVPVDGLEGVNLENTPRRLTETEINRVLAAIPPPTTPDPVTARIVQEQTAESMRRDLMKIELVPKAIDLFIQKIVKQHWKSQVVPGSSVGLTSSEAIGSTATQTTLNTFHSSGSAKSASFGISALSNFIYARPKPPGTFMYIHFRRKHMTPREILQTKMPLISACYIPELISSIDLVMIEDYRKLFAEFPWLNSAKDIQNRPLWNAQGHSFCRTALKFKINVSKMIKHKITMGKLAALLESEKPKSSIFAIYSSLEEGTLLLFPFLRENLGDLYSELDFYQTSILTDIVDKRVKGIAEVTNFRTISKPMNLLVREQNKTLDGKWELILDDDFARQFGVGAEDLLHLFELSGIPRQSVMFTGEYAALVSLPPGETRHPMTIVSDAVRVVKDKHNLELDEMAKTISRLDHTSAQYRQATRKFNNYPYPELLRADQITYAEADGHNIKALYALPGIDRNLSYSTNIHVINETLGIEAVWNFYVKGLYKTITDAGNSVHAANLIVTTDCITSTGQPKGVRFTGLVSRQPDGHMSNATMQKAMDVFTKASAFGSMETIENASTAISMGERITNGDGMNPVAQFITKQDGTEKMFLNDEVYLAHEEDPNTEELRRKFNINRAPVPVAVGEPLGEAAPLVLTGMATLPIGFANFGFEIPIPKIESEGLKFPNLPQLVKFPGQDGSLIRDLLRRRSRQQKARQDAFNYHEFLAATKRPVVYRIPTEQDAIALVNYLRQANR